MPLVSELNRRGWALVAVIAAIILAAWWPVMSSASADGVWSLCGNAVVTSCGKVQTVHCGAVVSVVTPNPRALHMRPPASAPARVRMPDVPTTPTTQAQSCVHALPHGLTTRLPHAYHTTSIYTFSCNNRGVEKNKKREGPR